MCVCVCFPEIEEKGSSLNYIAVLRAEKCNFGVQASPFDPDQSIDLDE